MRPQAIETQKSQPLYDSIVKAVESGYYENFKVINTGLGEVRLATQDEGSVYQSSEITIPHFYRFEEHSDPTPNSKFYLNSIVYLIETSDGKKGTLIDAYGTYADSRLASFIRKVEFTHRSKNIVVKPQKRSWLNFFF